jgi:hypothetical protein
MLARFARVQAHYATAWRLIREHHPDAARRFQGALQTLRSEADRLRRLQAAIAQAQEAVHAGQRDLGAYQLDLKGYTYQPVDVWVEVNRALRR